MFFELTLGFLSRESHDYNTSSNLLPYLHFQVLRTDVNWWFTFHLLVKQGMSSGCHCCNCISHDVLRLQKKTEKSNILEKNGQVMNNKMMLLAQRWIQDLVLHAPTITAT